MDSGLDPADIYVIARAAGGPKWLVLNALDRALFTSWIRDRQKLLYLVGSSIGSWRFAAAAGSDPESAIDRFELAYIRQAYSKDPPAEEIGRELEGMLNCLLGPDGTEQILSQS